GDFLLRYRAVSNKLKKRFLRKPNVSEASEQFGQLAKELKQQDCLQYAGFCNLAMARVPRCEQTLFNAPGEAMALTEAARLFLQAEKETHRLRCPGFEEHLQAAINCYSFAIKVYIELSQPIMAASLCLEVGNALKEMNKPGEAVVYFQRASELQTQVPIECLLSLGYVASCKILTRDYDGALAIFTEMQLLAQEKGLQTPGSCTPVGKSAKHANFSIIDCTTRKWGGGGTFPLILHFESCDHCWLRFLGAFLDVIAKCEISRVLLLLLLQPPPQKLLPEHAQTLEKYDWESFDSHSQGIWRGGAVNYLSENVFLLLQSVVMANQEKDVESMKILQVELWPLLTQEQNHLLHLVLQELISPSGQGV
uniref:Coagulation factor VIII associated n=1 Tax=Latimeria chalumnae TaxID=7897 RepID=H3AAP3_LATCH